MRRAFFALLALSTSVSCSGERAKLGVDEPVHCQYPALDGKRDAQFIAGAMPTGTSGPAIVAPQTQNTLIQQGALARKLTGNAKRGAQAVAFRLDDVGSGYWIAPVGAEDPSTDHELTWEMTCDFARSIPAGKHTMLFAATDESGAWGPSSEIPMEIQSHIPEGRAVLTLEWDSNADLDLHLISVETAKEIDPKHPSTALPGDAGADPTAPGVGVIDRDSNEACVLDNYRQEDVVWSSAPTPGQYVVRVNMFDACGAGAANFKVTLRIDGEERDVRTGRLLDLDANGGAGPGLYVMTLRF